MFLPPRLRPEDLSPSPEAYLEYAWRLADPHAQTWLTAFAERGDWSRWAVLWIDAAERAVTIRDPDVGEALAAVLGELLAKKLCAGRLGPEVHDPIRMVVMGDWPFARRAYVPVGRWLAANGRAGDAALMADWLTHSSARDDRDTRLALELALLERGSAELRRKDRLGLALGIVLEVDRARAGLRELALRTLLSNDSAREERQDAAIDPVRGWSWSGLARAFEKVGEQDIASLLDVIERAVGDGSDVSLVYDAASLMGWRAFISTAFKRGGLERVCAALVQRCAEGSVPVEGAVEECFRGLWDQRGALPPVRTPRAISAALGVVIGSAGCLTLAADQEQAAAWAETIAECWFDLHGLARGTTEGMRPLERLNAFERLLDQPPHRAGLRRALERRVAVGDSRAARVARQVLEAHPQDLGAVEVAFTALPRTAIRLEVAAGDVSADELTVELERLLLRPWHASLVGIDMAAVTAGVLRLDLVPLENERQFERMGSALRFDRSSVVQVVRGESGERALALAALFAVHEIVHGAQGLDDKATVDELRATGGEMTLLHVDLAADHAAALIVHEARPSWALDWLKDLHGANVRRFPAGRHHLVAARARKIARVVGLRLDYLVRAHALVHGKELRGGYVFAEFGVGGGNFVVLTSGPPLGVVGHCAMSDAEAQLIGRAADEAPPAVAALDATVLGLARRALERP